MRLPGFTAQQVFRSLEGCYQGGAGLAERRGIVVPSIPSAEGCQWALDNCDDPTGKSRACKLLKVCGGGRPKPSQQGGDFADYISCVVGCQGDKGCVDILC